MTGEETAAELRARLGALAEAAHAAPWITHQVDGQYTVDVIVGEDDLFEALSDDAALIVALVNAWPAIDGMLARLATAEADAEAGWKWAWRFDQWFGDSATSKLGDEERAEFQADLTCHENYGDPQ